MVFSDGENDAREINDEDDSMDPARWTISGVTVGELPLEMAREFRTNTKSIRAHRDLLVRLQIGETEGWGEGYTLELETARSAIDPELLRGRDPWDMEDLLEPVEHLRARSALDLALHDALSRRLALPLHRFLGLPRPRPATSASLSVGEDDRAVIEEARAWVGRGFRHLKLKMATATDPSLPLRVRDAVGDAAAIRVDGNQAWSLEQALEIFPHLERAGVEFCEQPVAVGESAVCAAIRRETRVPIYLDEEVTGPADVARVWRHGGVDGVNVKVTKCGGLRRSLETIRMARRLGLRVMIGCYFESSLATAAAVHLTALADAVDLDAPLFLAADPFTGLRYEDGRAVVGGTGIGVRPRTDAS
ncbi:MAG: dipeptide epimerase [Candidatus Eisenbacteria bacterium]|nr:dipeptide epimerase [Candidatus Eisenbacteria bacterium]